MFKSWKCTQLQSCIKSNGAVKENDKVFYFSKTISIIDVIPSLLGSAENSANI